jgi:ABC-type Zn uptake system ZnuABC Zn-binding protein ZnuA
MDNHNAKERKRMTRRLFLLALCVCLAVLLGGCASAPTAPEEDEGGLYLAASHYPAYLAGLQIVGGLADVRVDTFMQPQGGYLENFRLSELDWARAQAADILLMVGGGLEDFIPTFVVEGGKPVLVAGENVPRIPGRVVDPDESTEPSENPYTWLSPERWGQIVDGMAAGLAQLDPERSAGYIAANNVAQPRIEAMGARLGEAMQPYRNRQVIVMHPALAYLALDAGLDVVYMLDRDPSVQPGSGDMEEIRGLLAPWPDAVLLMEDSAPLALQDLDGRRTALCNVLCQGAQDGDASAWERAMEHNIATLEESLR